MAKKHKKEKKHLLRGEPNISELHRVKPLVDIVIAVYGRFDLLDMCLKSVPAAAKDILYNIILVDNNSPDQAEANEFYARWKDHVTLIRNQENLGFPRACNQGAKRGSAPLLFFLNSDVLLEPDAIWHMVRGLDDSKYGVVGMRLLFPPDSTDPIRPAGKIQHVGLASEIHGDFFHLFVGWSPDHPKTKAVDDVLAVTGAALMVRRNLFMQVGGFYEAYGTGTWEDVDLCVSLNALGFRTRVVQEAVGTHYLSATAAKYGIRYPMSLNRNIFLSRWQGKYPWNEWIYR